MAIAKRKKKFFEVQIPIIKKVTQARAFEIADLKGRFIRYDLTRTLRGKATILQGQIEIINNEAVLVPRKLQLMYFYLSRMVRKGTNYVEDSFSTPAQDSLIKIKPFLVTRKKVSRAVRKALRDKCREELIKYSEKKKTQEIFEDILSGKLQKTLSQILKKIYPLSCCEIRTIKVEEKTKSQAQKKEKETGKEEKAKEPKKQELEKENTKQEKESSEK